MPRTSRCCSNFVQEFKEFALRGNVVDLAVGIIVGTVFINIIQSLVDDIVTPPLGLILGGVDFGNLTIKMKNFVYEKQPPVVIRYGKFIQALISFIIVAMTVFFVIKTINKVNKITTKTKDTGEKEVIMPLETTAELKILCEIRDLLAKKM